MHPRHSFIVHVLVLLTVLSAGNAAALDAVRDEVPPAPERSRPEAAAALPPEGLSAASARLYQTRPLRVGIISLWETPETSLALTRTLEAIQRAFAPYPIEISPRVQWEELERRIRTGEIDVFIASSGYSMRMQAYGVVPLATLITRLQPNPNTGVATTFLARAGDERFRRLEDLEGATLSASYPTAFMSFRTGLGEIAAIGRDPERFFGSILWTGDSDNRAIADRLLQGEADVAMVRACWLESLPEGERAKFRVIAPRRSATLHCAHTSRTYPNIMVSIREGAPPGAAHVIARTLLSIPEIAPGHHWGVATDLRPVNRLYRELKIENFAYLRDPTFTQWIRDHLVECLLCLLLVLGLALHSWRVGYLVRKRTAELRNSIALEREARSKIDELRSRMERFHKATVVGQLSSLIAHELAQPLAAIQYYSEGLRSLLEAPVLDRKLLGMSRDGIAKGLARTKEIVSRVRGYSRKEVRRDAPVVLLETVERLYATVPPEVTQGVRFSMEGLYGVIVRGDALEIELLFNNLLRNAFEAAAGAHDGGAFVKVYGGTAPGRPGMIDVVVENTGRPLSADEFSDLTTPLITSKTAGHGLGVPIAIAIAEASGGSLAFEQRPGGGILARVTLENAPAPQDPQGEDRNASIHQPA